MDQGQGLVSRRGILQGDSDREHKSQVAHCVYKNGVTSESKIEDLLNGQQPEPEDEGDTRDRVAIRSKKWFEVESRLNGQRH